MSTWPRTGVGPLASRSIPRRRMPVPLSRMKRSFAAVRSSTQDVLPPKRVVWAPGVAMEPRVPQNLTRISRSDDDHAVQVGGQVVGPLPDGRGVLGARGVLEVVVEVGEGVEAVAAAGPAESMAERDRVAERRDVVVAMPEELRNQLLQIGIHLHEDRLRGFGHAAG